MRGRAAVEESLGISSGASQKRVAALVATDELDVDHNHSRNSREW